MVELIAANRAKAEFIDRAIMTIELVWPLTIPIFKYEQNVTSFFLLMNEKQKKKILIKKQLETDRNNKIGENTMKSSSGFVASFSSVKTAAVYLLGPALKCCTFGLIG